MEPIMTIARGTGSDSDGLSGHSRNGARKRPRLSEYEQAFNRIQAEFIETAGMHLTPEQVGRLAGVSIGVCRVVLDDLLRGGFLSVDGHGTYAQLTELDRLTPSAVSGGGGPPCPTVRRLATR